MRDFVDAAAFGHSAFARLECSVEALNFDRIPTRACSACKERLRSISNQKGIPQARDSIRSVRPVFCLDASLPPLRESRLFLWALRNLS